MTINFEVRRAEAADASSMARVHVDTWRENYRGLMSDAVLDDPALLDWREKFWTAALTDSRYEQNSVAVASHEVALIAQPRLLPSGSPTPIREHKPSTGKTVS